MSAPSPKAVLGRLAPAAGASRRRKRLGRGIGSGTGKTCGRGHKGQKSRAGKKLKFGFEGGQMPLHRRIPKRGFSSPVASSWLRLPTAALARLAPGEVTLASLRAAGLAAVRHRSVKVYLGGALKEGYDLVGIAASAGAKTAIEKAGGSVKPAAAAPAAPAPASEPAPKEPPATSS